MKQKEPPQFFKGLKLHNLIKINFLTTALVVGVLLVGSNAVEQQEQIDEANRNFETYGEIDYRNVNFVDQNRTYVHKEEGFPFLLGVDYDPYTKKAVCSVNIAKEGTKVELFIVDADLSDDGKTAIIYDTNNQRVTYDSVNKEILNVDPFWTKDRQVIYMVAALNKKENAYDIETYIINMDGTNKRAIDPKEFGRLRVEAHDKKTGLVNVPPPK